MQVIANILYNDMNVLLLIVGFTLFISLIQLINNFYSLVLKKRNTLSNVDIYKVLENLRLVELIILISNNLIHKSALISNFFI